MPHAINFDKDKTIYYLWGKLKHRYKPRGIPVYQIWEDSFEIFSKDIGSRPSKYHNLALWDKQMGFFPGNCYWYIPPYNEFLLQNFSIGEKSLPIYEWCGIYNIKPRVVYTRHIKGLDDIYKCLTLPLNSKPHVRSDKLPEEERKRRESIRHKKFQEKNKEKIKEYRKKIWKRKDKKAAAKKLMEWHKKNPQKRNEYNKKRLECYGPEYFRKKKTTEKYKASARKRHQERYNNEPEYKLMRRVRARFNQAVKSAKSGKLYSTLSVTGASWVSLRKYLENKFQEGMTWDSNGERTIHIDHIMPVAMFNLSEPNEQIKCFHFTNLQPLWAKENQSKHCTYRGDDSHIDVRAELNVDGNIIYNLDYNI